jgi:hypothetical protein
MDRAAALAAIDRAFGTLARPAVMGRSPQHCDECADHEATMQAVTPETVTLEQVGNPAWDPICYVTDEAFCYFMPGLARLALGTGEDYYLDQFLFHLEQGFRIDAFTAEQRRAVALLLDHIAAIMLNNPQADLDLDRLGHVMDTLAWP